MTENPMTEITRTKIRTLLENAWASLPESDRRRRTAHDEARGIIGAASYREGENVVFVRGGRKLATVAAAKLFDDAVTLSPGDVEVAANDGAD